MKTYIHLRMITTRSVLPGVRNVSETVLEKIKARILYS